MRKVPEGRNRHQGALTLIFVMALGGVGKVILSFYRDDEGSHSNGAEVVYRSILKSIIQWRTFDRIHGNQTASGNVRTRKLRFKVVSTGKD